MDKKAVYERIKQIESRLEAAARYPWSVASDGHVYFGPLHSSVPGESGVVCDPPGPASTIASHEKWPANRNLIVKAPEDLKFLCEQLREFVEPKPRNPITDPRPHDIFLRKDGSILHPKVYTILPSQNAGTVTARVDELLHCWTIDYWRSLAGELTVVHKNGEYA